MTNGKKVKALLAQNAPQLKWKYCSYLFLSPSTQKYNS